MKNSIFVWGAFGLGDHIVLNGLTRYLLDKYRICIIPTISHNYYSVRAMYSDEKRILVKNYPSFRWFEFVSGHLKILRRQGVENLPLGILGKDFLVQQNVRLDELFYMQAQVPFDVRWTHFYAPRNIQREIQLFDQFQLIKNEYIFLHEDRDRNFLIDRDSIPRGIRIFEPKKTRGVSILDYRYIIENSAEIHCIESSFSAFIENLGLPNVKFAHRYSRPEASNDYRYEYTYRGNWSILV